MSPHALVLRNGRMIIMIDTSLNSRWVLCINVVYDGIELPTMHVGLQALAEFVRLANER